MDIQILESIVKKAHEASFDIATFNTQKKNAILKSIHDVLVKNKDFIFKENTIDVNEAKDKGLNEALVDRLRFNDTRFDEMTDGILRVIALDDPVGHVFDGKSVPSTLDIKKVAVPFGLIGVIYESRPNVTVDIASLCIKSGNAVILRGGSEAFNTNKCLYRLMQEAISSYDVNKDIVTLIESKDRDDVLNMLSMDKYIDVIIPRGGESLHRLCQKHSTIPVIVGGFGISHIFVDYSADRDKTSNLILNAKTSKPSACNSLDTILLHKSLEKEFVVKIACDLIKANVRLYVDSNLKSLLDSFNIDNVYMLDDKSFDTEYLSLSVNMTYVDDVYMALSHMQKHGAIHSDSILTNDLKNAKIFCQRATSSCVYVNASTRFTDGGQFGMGSEVAISTQKLHVRGPMGLNELTTYKYICTGDYLIRK